MVDSREFQGVESACISRLTHAPSQPVIVSSPCGIIVSRPCGIAAIIASDLIRETNSLHQETFLEIHLHQLNRQHLFPKGCCMEEIPFLHLRAPCFQVQGNLQPEEKKSTRTSSTWFSPSHAEGVFLQIYILHHQRLQISDLHVDKFPSPSTFLCWKIRFKTEVCACSRSPRKQCYG